MSTTRSSAHPPSAGSRRKYLATWPVYVVGDDPASLSVSIEVDDPHGTWLQGADAADGFAGGEDSAAARREYLTRQVRHRLHQRTFRERVLSAYRRQCALCRFRHEELLDAAHIIADGEEDGEPVVPNGLSLCRLHHGAYDRKFLGVRPDRNPERWWWTSRHRPSLGVPVLEPGAPAPPEAIPGRAGRPAHAAGASVGRQHPTEHEQ